MERGELQGRCDGGVEPLDNSHPDWVRDGRVKFSIQFSIKRGRALPEVPTAFELARDDHVRAAMKLVLARPK